EASSFHARTASPPHPIKAFKNPLQLVLWNAYALIAHAQNDVLAAGCREFDRNMHAAGRILDCIVEQVAHGRVQLLGIAEHARTASLRKRLLVSELLRKKVMAGARQLHAFAHERIEIHRNALAGSLLLRHCACLKYLFDDPHEALGIDQHELIKLLPPRLIYLATLQGFEIKTDGGDGSLQFVRDGVDEAVVLLVAPNLAHQKNGIEDEAGDNRAEEDDAEKDLDACAPVEDDPAAAHREGHRRQADAEREEEINRFAPAGDPHREIVNTSPPRRGGRQENRGIDLAGRGGCRGERFRGYECNRDFFTNHHWQ